MRIDRQLLCLPLLLSLWITPTFVAASNQDEVASETPESANTVAPVDEEPSEDTSEATPPSPTSPPTALSEAELLPVFLSLTRATDSTEQLRGLSAAAKLGHPFLIRPIRYLLSQGVYEVRAEACQTLAAFRDINVLPDIFAAIDAGPEHVALRCSSALSRFPLPGVRRKLHALASNRGQPVALRKSAIEALASMGTVEARADLERLLASLQESDLLEYVRGHITDAPQVPEPKKLFVLRKLMNPDRPSGRSEATAEVAPSFAQPDTRELLHLALRDPMPEVRRATLMVATSLDSALRIELLSASIDEHHDGVIRAWSTLFKTLPEEARVPLLLQALDTPRPLPMRRNAIVLMGTEDDLLHSPRATESLILLFADPKDPLHWPQAQLLSKMPSDAATNALLSVLGKVEEPVRVRGLALDELITQPATTAVDRLVTLTTSEPDSDLRLRAADALVEHFCQELGETCRHYVRERPSKQAETLLIATSAAFGATSLALLSETAGGNQPIIAGFSGAFLGGGSTYLLGLGNDVKPNQTLHYASAGVWGTVLGASAAGVAGLDSESQDFKWLTLGGQLAGVYLGATTLDGVNRTTGELVFANLSGIEAFITTGGMLTLFAPDNDSGRGPYAAALGGLAIGAIPGWLFGPDLHFSKRDKAHVVYSSLLGASLGALLGPTFGTQEDRNLELGGILAGQGLGYLAGITASQYADISPGRLGWMLTASAAGGGIGFGLGALINDDLSDNEPAAAAGIALSTLGAGLLSDHFDLRPEDFDMALTSGLSGFLLGGLAPPTFGSDSGTLALGSAIALGSTGFLGGLVHDHLNHVRGRDATLTFLGTALGVSTGSSFIYLLDDDENDDAAVRAGEFMGTASLLAFLTLGPDLVFEGGDERLVLTSMAAATSIGSLLPAMLDLDSDPVFGATFGAGIGFGAGLVWSQFSDYDTSDGSEIFFDTLLGGLAGGGLAMLTPETFVGSRGDSWLASLGIAGGLTLGALSAPGTDFTSEDQWLISFATLYGGFSGAWIPYMWSPNSEASHEREEYMIGGAMMGGALLGAAAMSVSQHLEFTTSDVQETALGAIASNLFGAGVGLLIPADDDDPRAWATSMTGLGLVGTAATAWLAPQTDFSEGDRTLGLLTTAFSAWQGVGASLLLDGTERQVAGATLATTAIGAFAGAAIGQRTSLTTPEVVVAFSGSVWGAWLGGMGSLALGLEDNDLIGGYYVGSDVGILLSGLALSPLGGFSPSRVGWINLAGLTGMAAGSALGAIFPQLPFWTTNVTFSALGLVGGTIWTHYNPQPNLFEDSNDTDSSDESTQSSFPSPFGEVVALMPQVSVIPSQDNEPQVVFGLMGILH